MEDRDPPMAAEAEAAFAAYVARVQQGFEINFEAYCAARPEMEDSLRQLHRAWSATTRPPPSSPGKNPSIRDFLQRDTAVRPEIDLDDEAPADQGSGVRDRLAQIASRGDRYTLRDEVARGGMGVILRVWDKDLRRTLAMKASFESIDGDAAASTSESVARFLDEAQITSQLDHPGIVPVHEIGVDGDGRVYFTMRLVKGKTLDQIIKLARSDQEGWTRAGAVGVMVKVCEAMAYAHSKGVIHRDLKPANVMVGKFGEVYVMDWGLAKVIGQTERGPRPPEASVLHTQVRTDRLEDSNRESPLATMEGAVIGTPAYMPPEQAEGRIEDLDPRSDVYSVGALLYALLTGRMPYFDPDRKQNAADVLMALLAGPPTPVSELDTSVTPELLAICDKAMARDPDERYATMIEMAHDLSAFVENRVVRAYRTGAMAEFRKWVSRNRVTATVLAALILLLVVGSVFVAWQQNARYAEVNEAHKLTVAARGRAVANERRALANARKAQVNSERAERQSYLANLAAAYASLRMYETGEAKQLLQACPPRFRGWEWRHLELSTDTSTAVLSGHGDKVTAVAFNADGTRIASGSEDKTVRIWDADDPSKGPLFTLPGSPDAITALAFSPDGSRVAAASKDMLVRVWDADAARLVGTLTHESLVTALAFQKDGERLVTATDEGAHLWNMRDYQKLFALEHDDPIHAVAMTDDGALILTGDESGVRVWDVKERKQLRAIELPDAVTCLAVKGSRVAAGSLDESVYLIDMDSGATLATMRGHADPVTAVAFADAEIVSASHDKTVRVWDAEDGGALAVLQGHDKAILAADCVGNRIVSASADGTLRLWKAAEGGNVITLHGDDDFLSAVAFDPEGGRVAAASAGHGEIRIFDTTTGREVLQIPENGGALSSLAFSPDGKWIVAGCEGDATTRVHDAKDGTRRWTLSGHDLSVTSVAVSRDSRLVATGSADGTVRVWDLADGTEHSVLKHSGGVTGVAFGAGRQLAASANDGTARIWNLAEDDPAKEPLVIRGHEGAVLATAFSPDGAWLATAGRDQTVRVWAVKNGALGSVLRGHGAAVRAVAFHPTEARIASAGQDKTIRIWDAGDGAPLLRIQGHQEWVTSVAFSPDGSLLASASLDTTARIWR